MSPGNTRIKKEGIWYYALDGDTAWRQVVGMKGVVTYAKANMQRGNTSTRGINASSTNCRIGTQLAQSFLGVHSSSLPLHAGEVKYFKKYNLRVTHTTMPSVLAAKINRETICKYQEDGVIEGETIVYRV